MPLNCHFTTQLQKIASNFAKQKPNYHEQKNNMNNHYGNTTCGRRNY